MDGKRTIILIPNDEMFDFPVYKSSSTELYHEEMYKKFSSCYFDYNYDKFHLMEMNFIICESFDDIMMCWVPNKITEKQYSRLLECKEFLTEFPVFDAGIYEEASIELINENEWPDNKNRIEYFFNKVKEECLKMGGRK